MLGTIEGLGASWSLHAAGQVSAPRRIHALIRAPTSGAAIRGRTTGITRGSGHSTGAFLSIPRAFIFDVKV